MSKVTIGFLKSGLIYLGLGVLLGIHLSAGGPERSFIPAHTHLNLLGWMNMMIFGVAYHILPRFSGNPLWSEKLSIWHLWLANIGLIGMLVGWAILFTDSTSNIVLLIFSVVQAVSVLLFIINMFKTLRAAPAPMCGASIGNSEQPK